MAEKLYALGDIGASNLRIGVYGEHSEGLGIYYTSTEPGDYEGTVQLVADRAREMAGSRGEVVAASVAVAGEVDESGILTRSGGLTPWIGKNLAHDLGAALGLPDDLVGVPNDVVAIALSQQHINLENGKPAQGIATTLSSGWGGTLYWEEAGITRADEPGHEHLRDGGMCPCGQEGHTEAFVSGIGVKINHGMDMPTWLANTPGASTQLVDDLSRATVAMIGRVEGAESDMAFQAEEIRWTGGVALGQPFLMRRVAEAVQAHHDELGIARKIAFDTVTMGDQAGVHGTFIDAQRRVSVH